MQREVAYEHYGHLACTVSLRESYKAEGKVDIRQIQDEVRQQIRRLVWL